ncbi:hypothetical protein [Candidatus Ruthia endofausta]|uniref:hypothetical protein n=1 Tax=Candidatus Ruthia endofausta TaxID=2738852 RepID=UPI001FE35145|nr:hypothetical protein [Candidatus Ruthia endofausta]
MAQNPPKNRTDSWLLIAQSEIIDKQFNKITQAGDLLVMNNIKDSCTPVWA